VGLAGSDVYCTMPPELWYDVTLSLRRDDADVYFISCANIHSMDVIEQLEKVLEKPVVTSNQAALWCALRTIGIGDVVSGLGRLMRIERLEPAAAA
jgi:maleate isomerase